MIRKWSQRDFSGLSVELVETCSAGSGSRLMLLPCDSCYPELFGKSRSRCFTAWRKHLEMGRSLTRCFRWEALQAKTDHVLVIQLVMACNDMQYSNLALRNWRKRSLRDSVLDNPGPGMYFVRLQIGHLFEGLKIIERIRESAELMAIVKSSDEQTRASFDELEKYVKGGPERQTLEKLAGKIRHNLTFHYDESES